MATTTNYSWTTPDDTDLVKDGASAIRTLGSAIDTTVFNNAAAAVAKSTIDAKGDLLVGTADNTVGRLAVGTDGYTLVADSSVSPTGLKWAAPAGGGKVLQVVYGSTNSAASSSSSTYADTNLTATITPTSATSTILIMVAQQVTKSAASASNELKIRIMRGATSIQEFITAQGIFTGSALAIVNFTVASYYQDSPATTSATTYKTQFASVNSTATLTCQNGGDSTSSIILMEIGA